MLGLRIDAEFDGVAELRPDDGEENPFLWTFKVQCTSCREIHPNWITISRHESHSTGRGEANFVWKCRNCSREHSANVVETHTTDGKGVIAKFDCRGLELVEFRADGDWLARGTETGTKFTVDLSEAEWYDYDEKAGEVSIKEVRWEICRV